MAVTTARVTRGSDALCAPLSVVGAYRLAQIGVGILGRGRLGKAGLDPHSKRRHQLGRQLGRDVSSEPADSRAVGALTGRRGQQLAGRQRRVGEGGAGRVHVALDVILRGREQLRGRRLGIAAHRVEHLVLLVGELALHVASQAALQLADHEGVALGQREVVGTGADLVVLARRGVGGDQAGRGLTVNLVARRPRT